MGMGYAACHAQVIDEENLKKVDPEIKELFKLLEATIEDNENFDFNEFTRMCAYCNTLEDMLKELNGQDDLPSDVVKVAWKIVDKITKAFKKKTKLDLYLDYHNSEEDGSRYDDVDGVIWIVGGCYIKSPAFKALEKRKIQVADVMWVNYG